MPPERYNGPDVITQEARILAAMGYIPMLFLIPLLVKPRDSYCRFHGIQSLLFLGGLTVFWTGIYITDLLVGKILGNVILIGFIFKAAAWIIHYIVGTVISLTYIVLIIAGFIQAAAGQYWHPPVIGEYLNRLHRVNNKGA